MNMTTKGLRGRFGSVVCGVIGVCALRFTPKTWLRLLSKGIRDTKRHEEHDVLAVESLADDAKNLKERVFRCHTNLVTPKNCSFIC